MCLKVPESLISSHSGWFQFSLGFDGLGTSGYRGALRLSQSPSFWICPFPHNCIQVFHLCSEGHRMDTVSLMYVSCDTLLFIYFVL